MFRNSRNNPKVAKMIRLTLAMLVALSFLGCQTSGFGARAFRPPSGAYELEYTVEESKIFLDENWIVDNYSSKYDDYALRTVEIQQRKTGPEYYGALYPIYNADPYKDYFADIVLKHIETDARLFISTRAVMAFENNWDHHVDIYADSLTTDPPFIFGDLYSARPKEPQKNLVRIFEKRETDFHGKKAVEVTFDLFNIKDWFTDEEAIDSRLKVMIVQCNPSNPRYIYAKPYPRALIIVGYHATEDFFYEHLPEFDGLANKITLMC